MKRPAAYTSLKVLGVASLAQTDELVNCNEPNQPWFQPDPAEFERVWCRLCRNPGCKRAQGGHQSPWTQRMREQPEYLLNNPQFSDLTSPAHQELASQDFRPLNQKAERLEISAKAQDWTIPDVPMTGTPSSGIPSGGTQGGAPPVSGTVQPSLPGKPKKPPRNTPAPGGAGKMVGGGSAPPVEEKDPWTPTSTRGTLIQPGAKVVLR